MLLLSEKKSRNRFGNKSEKMLVLTVFGVLAILTICLSSFVSAAQPFNVEIELPDTYQTVQPGSEVWFTIKLLNLANEQRMDITLNYDILDSAGQSIVHNSKTVAIETQASFVADLKLPETIPVGDYFITVTVNSSLGESSAKTSLEVDSKERNMVPYYVATAIAGLAILILIVIKSRLFIEKLKLKWTISRIVREKLKNK